jgi:hypothetical protein
MHAAQRFISVRKYVRYFKLPGFRQQPPQLAVAPSRKTRSLNLS